MTCYKRRQAFVSREKSSLGFNKVTFREDEAVGACVRRPLKTTVSCGKCIGCRYSKNRQWAVRCMHESDFHDENSFITLTYSDKFLPRIYSNDNRILGVGDLNYEHWTNFLKRLRFALDPLRIRFFMGPEYGSKFGRPHYHAIIFGYGFPDKKFYKKSNGFDLYRSKFLESLWTHPKTHESYGFSTVGTCTYQSSAYVAGYVLSKADYEGSDKYKRFSLETGEVYYLKPEMARMSNRNGIGYEWFKQYYDSDIYRKDFITLGNGTIVRPPSYYDDLLRKIDPKVFVNIMKSRNFFIEKNKEKYSEERLRDGEINLRARLSLFSRDQFLGDVL